MHSDIKLIYNLRFNELIQHFSIFSACPQLDSAATAINPDDLRKRFNPSSVFLFVL